MAESNSMEFVEPKEMETGTQEGMGCLGRSVVKKLQEWRVELLSSLIYFLIQ